jgi:hypothetical protein
MKTLKITDEEYNFLSRGKVKDYRFHNMILTDFTVRLMIGYEYEFMGFKIPWLL